MGSEWLADYRILDLYKELYRNSVIASFFKKKNNVITHIRARVASWIRQNNMSGFHNIERIQFQLLLYE